jgi:hypothetical protein
MIRAVLVGMLALTSLGLLAGPAAAHQHGIDLDGDGIVGADEPVLANGQNHYAFIAQGDGTFLSCDTNTPLAGVGPAWFGLETAQHGPDSGEQGKGDGCYLADASPLSEADDVNPAID